MLRLNLLVGFQLFVPQKPIVAAIALCAVFIAGVVPSGAFASEETDRDALVAFYRATDGDNWYRNENWLTNAPIDTWYGVITDRMGRVIELSLSENDLSGSIPPVLGKTH